MKKLATLLLAGAFLFFVAAPVTAVTLPTQASAANSACEGGFLGIPPWYRGLTEGSDCTIMSPKDLATSKGVSEQDALTTFIWTVVLNGIQIALTLGSYLAIFFIIYGGFLFMTGGSNPSQVEKGRKAVLNAIVGLVILLGAIAITNFIFSLIGSVDTKAANADTLLLANALNLVYFIAGTISVIVIIIGGIMFATSAGDAGKVTRSKNMLTYAIVGLVIILVAFAITNFVTGRFG